MPRRIVTIHETKSSFAVILGAFTTLRKATISVYLSVRPTV